jgi:hypothetical protein
MPGLPVGGQAEGPRHGGRASATCKPDAAARNGTGNLFSWTGLAGLSAPSGKRVAAGVGKG